MLHQARDEGRGFGNLCMQGGRGREREVFAKTPPFTRERKGGGALA